MWANCWRNKKCLENLTELSNEQSILVTKTHLIWAELGSHLKDYEPRVKKNFELSMGIVTADPEVAAPAPAPEPAPQAKKKKKADDDDEDED
jgi:hypothetical protein